MLEIGTRLRVKVDPINEEHPAKGAMATIVGYRHSNVYVVEFDDTFGVGHNCHGRVPYGKGRWVFENHCDLEWGRVNTIDQFEIIENISIPAEDGTITHVQNGKIYEITVRSKKLLPKAGDIVHSDLYYFVFTGIQRVIPPTEWEYNPTTDTCQRGIYDVGWLVTPVTEHAVEAME